MSLEARKVALERRHAELEAELRTIAVKPAADTLNASQLKREKLKLKDEIARLKN